MGRIKGLLALSCILLLFVSRGFSQYPAVNIKDTTGFGNNIQRTMKLLTTSTAIHRNTVKIEIYGQSWEKQE